jgi:hypothetical protein
MLGSKRVSASQIHGVMLVLWWRDIDIVSVFLFMGFMFSPNILTSSAQTRSWCTPISPTSKNLSAPRKCAGDWLSRVTQNSSYKSFETCLVGPMLYVYNCKVSGNFTLSLKLLSSGTFCHRLLNANANLCLYGFKHTLAVVASLHSV